MILDPERPICDPHHHLWEHPEHPYLLPDLLADTGSGHNIVSTVFVECLSGYREDGDPLLAPVGETEFVDKIASSQALPGLEVCAGIVSFADLLQGGTIGAVLDAHAAASERFRGVRHAAAFDAHPDIRESHHKPPPGLYRRDDFREGFAELGRRGLSFDAWLFHPQISELTELARAFPDTTIVLDHFGGPLDIGPYAGARDAIYPQWQQDIKSLAACDNVHAKLGGILMPINGFRNLSQPLTAEEIVAATGRYYQHTINCFGVQRCMFESNFPVDKSSCSYAELWNAFKLMARDFTAREQDALFHDVAARVYRL